MFVSKVRENILWKEKCLLLQEHHKSQIKLHTAEFCFIPVGVPRHLFPSTRAQESRKPHPGAGFYYKCRYADATQHVFTRIITRCRCFIEHARDRPIRPNLFASRKMAWIICTYACVGPASVLLLLLLCRVCSWNTATWGLRNVHNNIGLHAYTTHVYIAQNNFAHLAYIVQIHALDKKFRKSGPIARTAPLAIYPVPGLN